MGSYISRIQEYLPWLISRLNVDKNYKLVALVYPSIMLAFMLWKKKEL